MPSSLSPHGDRRTLAPWMLLVVAIGSLACGDASPRASSADADRTHVLGITICTLRALSLLDYAIPVCLVIIGILGYSMAAHHGPIWEFPWIHESAFGLFVYTFFGLVITIAFRRTRMNLEEETRSSAGVYVASGVGILFLLVMTGIMVYKAAPLRTAHHFTPIAQYFSGGQ